MALLPQSLWLSVGHGEIYKIGPLRSGSKWSERFLEMAENKWATGGTFFGAPTYNWRNLFCLEIFCVQTKNHRNKRGESKKKKTPHGKKKEIPGEMGGCLFVTEKGLGLSDSRCTSCFFIGRHWPPTYGDRHQKHSMFHSHDFK